jgi:hypothetical protein
MEVARGSREVDQRREEDGEARWGGEDGEAYIYPSIVTNEER